MYVLDAERATCDAHAMKLIIEGVEMMGTMIVRFRAPGTVEIDTGSVPANEFSNLNPLELDHARGELGPNNEPSEVDVKRPSDEDLYPAKWRKFEQVYTG